MDSGNNNDKHDATVLERLTFFSYAVFAIAITLLVIEVRPPELHEVSDQSLLYALVALTPKYIGFFISFCVIGRFWLGHHRLFGLLRRSDDKLVLANLAMLFGIAFMPFPTAVFSEYFALKTSALLYAGWLILLGLLNANVVRLATRPEILAPGHDAALARRIRRGAWLPILLGIAAVCAAFVAPGWVLLVLVLGPVLGTLAVRWSTRRGAGN